MKMQLNQKSVLFVFSFFLSKCVILTKMFHFPSELSVCFVHWSASRV